MADEVEEPREETEDGGTVIVEVEKERGRPPIKDEDLGKLTQVNDDEISRANESAQKAVRSLRAAYQEQRRRTETAQRDSATASNLAEQLYRENQELRHNVTRSESALIDQALSRAEAQLEHAKTRARAALESGDADKIVSSNEDVARAVTEVDRLKILQPAAAAADQEAAQNVNQPMPQAAPSVSDRTRSWIAENSWWGRDQEMTQFAMRQHHHLALDGVTEETNPDLYWRTIESKLKEQYPDKFGGAKPAEASRSPRPSAVTGGMRSNGNGAASTPTANGRRVVHLTESQLRIASRLSLTPQQYAEQLVKDEAEEEREKRGRRVQ
jgi:hypothetical protein